MNELPYLISKMSAYASISVDFPAPHKSFSIPMFTNASVFSEAAEYASAIKVFHLSRVDKPPIHSTSLIL